MASKQNLTIETEIDEFLPSMTHVRLIKDGRVVSETTTATLLKCGVELASANLRYGYLNEPLPASYRKKSK